MAVRHSLIHNIVFKSASDTRVSVVCKVVLLAQLGYFYVRAHVEVVDRLSIALLDETLLIDRLVKMIFSMERLAIMNQSHAVGIFSKCAALWDSLDIFKTDSGIGAIWLIRQKERQDATVLKFIMRRNFPERRDDGTGHKQQRQAWLQCFSPYLYVQLIPLARFKHCERPATNVCTCISYIFQKIDKIVELSAKKTCTGVPDGIVQND